MPPSNSISQFVTHGNELWIGTGKGVAKSTNFGLSWTSFAGNSAFSDQGIFALDLIGDTIWAATGYDKSMSGGGTVQTGSGYTVSTNDGISWTHLPQTVDLRGDSIISYGINDSLWLLPVVVPEQNVTFDISLTPGTAWIASWASGLRKSTDNGTTWKRVILPPDGRFSLRPSDTMWTYAAGDTLHHHRIFQKLDPRNNNNMLAFAVHAVDSNIIWCGTAGGVNKSTNGGKSWTRYTHQSQQLGILGDWVIAVNVQDLGGIQRVWTTNWRAEDPSEEFGVSYTDDDGLTWTTLLRGVKAYDFAFKGATAYIATDDGLFRTTDDGASFTSYANFSNPQTRDIINGAKVFCVQVLGDTVYAGTGDGLVSTVDNGTGVFGASWKIYRTYQPTGVSSATYAYPNPFSPNHGQVRIHYGSSVSAAQRLVSIDIFDFGMNRVRSLIHDAPRDGSREYDELWDGRTDDGKLVANGAYIYRVKTDINEPFFGKILVLQ